MIEITLGEIIFSVVFAVVVTTLLFALTDFCSAMYLRFVKHFNIKSVWLQTYEYREVRLAEHKESESK